MSAHVQIGFGQENVLRLEAEWRVERALHAAQRDKGGRYQQSAKRNLNGEEKISEREAAKDESTGSATLHHLRGVGGPDLPRRNQAPKDSAADREEQRHQVNLWIRSDGHTNG